MEPERSSNIFTKQKAPTSLVSGLLNFAGKPTFYEAIVTTVFISPKHTQVLLDFIALTIFNFGSVERFSYPGVSQPNKATFPSGLLCTPQPYCFGSGDARKQGCPFEKNCSLADGSSSFVNPLRSAYT